MTVTVRDHRLIRAAKNQSLFREVNERVEELNESFRIFTEVGDWVCECANGTCIERLPMTLPEYTALRSDGNRFAVKPGHEQPDVEAIVDRHEHYLVVAKLGAGGVFALEHDPRHDR
jgi:hypothetical protein